MIAEYCINAIHIAGTVVVCALALLCTIGLLGCCYLLFTTIKEYLF